MARATNLTKKKRNKQQNPTWRVNEQITASEIRVIGADNKQVGILSKKEALSLAAEAGLELVEIAPKVKPPVAKITNFGKFRYQQEKRAREQKKKTKTAEVKEVRFSPFIAKGDYQTRLKKVKNFLGDGNKVRMVVVFKGRQLGAREFGYKLMGETLELLGDRVIVDMKPKFLGRHLVMVISPLKKPKQNEAKN